MRYLHFERIFTLETILHENHLRTELVQLYSRIMKLLDLREELFGYDSNFLLAKGSLDICEHIKVTSALARKFGTCIVQAIFSLVEIRIEGCWILYRLQSL